MLLIETKQDLKDYIIQARKNKGIKASVISREIGITKCTISRFETGKYDMKFSDFIKYAEFIGFDIKLYAK